MYILLFSSLPLLYFIFYDTCIYPDIALSMKEYIYVITLHDIDTDYAFFVP